MKSKKFPFTKNALEKLKPAPMGKRLSYQDSQTRGLSLIVTETGNMSCVVRRTISAKPEKFTLGRYPDLSIEAARGLAAEIHAKIAKGLNPRQEKIKEYSIGDLFERYLDQHAKLHKKSWKNDARMYQLYLKDWSEYRLSLIGRCDIEALQAKISQKHPSKKNGGLYAANRTLALLSKMFSKAVDWQWLSINPASKIKMFEEKSRERFLQEDELPRFFKALDAEPNQDFADVFRLCLFTGARRSNVLAMKWQDIQIEKAEWEIPETKNGDSHLVPLLPQALEILTGRRSRAGRGAGWVFSSATSQSGHLEGVQRVWTRLLKDAALENLRIHDLRRTLGSWLAITGANNFTIGKTLGHKTQQATAVYARLNTKAVRDSVAKATEVMLGF